VLQQAYKWIITPQSFGDGCINKGNGVSGNHSFIIFTPLIMAIGGILVPYALMQHNSYHGTYLTKA